MTTREFYTEISKLTNIDSALVEHAAEALAKLEAQSEVRKAKAAEKSAEKQAAKNPLRNALFAVIGDAENPKTASMLIAEAGLTETVKPASVPSLLKPFVESGDVIKVDVKITGKGTQRGYVKA